MTPLRPHAACSAVAQGAAVCVLLLVFYVLSYWLLLDHQVVLTEVAVFPGPAGISEVAIHRPRYHIETPGIDLLFCPIHGVDRIVRTHVWQDEVSVLPASEE